MTERALFDLLRRLLPPTVHLVRIETSTQNGVPDVNGCIEGHEFWIELKRDANAEIRPAQAAWATRRLGSGGNVMLLHMSKDKHLTFRRIGSLIEHTFVPSYAAVPKLKELLKNKGEW